LVAKRKRTVLLEW